MTDDQATNLLAALPQSMAEAILHRAREKQESVRVAISGLLEQRLRAEPPVRTNLSDFIGSWEEDPEFDKAIAAFEMIDEDLWR